MGKMQLLKIPRAVWIYGKTLGLSRFRYASGFDTLRTQPGASTQGLRIEIKSSVAFCAKTKSCSLRSASNLRLRWFSAVAFCMLILGCIFLYGCGGGEESATERWNGDYYTELQNLVFYGTWEIPLEITPNVSQPAIAWNTTGLKYVVITIFDSKVDIKAERIANPQDAVWTWNTGLGRGREGNISFSDGFDMRNGEIQNTTTPLRAGIYYIAAWGYDENYRLTRSSKEYQYVYSP